MLFQTILVPLDGSQPAEQALALAAHIVRATGRFLFLLRIPNTSHGFVLFPQDRCPKLSSLRVYERRVAEHSLLDLSSKEEFKGLPLREIESRDGDPAQAILASAQFHQATMIAMGRQEEESSLQRWRHDSVSWKVAHSSPIPVLVPGPDRAESRLLSRNAPGTVRVLVPLDGTSFAEHSLSMALHLTEALSAPSIGALHLVQVVPSVREDQQLFVRSAQKYLSTLKYAFIEHIIGKRLMVSTSVIVGKDIAQAVVAMAEGGTGGEETTDVPPCDCIVMATHNESGIRRWIVSRHRGNCDILALVTHRRADLGTWISESVTASLLEVCPIPLLIVPTSS